MTLTSNKNLLGYNITTLNFEKIIEFITAKINAKSSCHVVTINPEIIEMANKNAPFKKAIEEANILVPDGIGIVLGFKINGTKIKRTPGIEISETLIKKADKEGFKIGLLGASQKVIELTKENLLAKYPNLKIGFCQNGFFGKEDEKDIIQEILNNKIQILFVAMGIPKQEIFINNYKKELNRTIMIGVGGSFDVWANKTQRAPKIFQQLGLEWFYRLLCQPTRFSRIFPTLPLFLLKVIHSKLKGDNS